MGSMSGKAKPWLREKGRRHGSIKGAMKTHKAFPSSAFPSKVSQVKCLKEPNYFIQLPALKKCCFLLNFLKVSPAL